MKIILLILFVIFNTNLYANEKWIEIKSLNKYIEEKEQAKVDVNLSQIQPINQAMKKVAVFKQLVDISSKKEKVTVSDKNWFILNNKSNQ